MAPSAPFRLRVRSSNSQTSGHESPRDGAPGSHLARRRNSEARLEAVGTKRRDESGPPTKPSIVPPSPRPDGRLTPTGEEPLSALERAAPTLTYSVVLVLLGAALGVGALIAAWTAAQKGGTWLSGGLWFVAASTLVFSTSMAVVLTLSFSRRLRALAALSWRLAQHKSEPPLGPPPGDALTSLALSVTKMSERITELFAELEQCVEEEQARVDELVRERTRALSRESEDLRRLLGDSKGLLTLDREGRVVAYSPLLERWLGSMPRTGQFWEYLERASIGIGARFEVGWAKAIATPSSPDLTSMPTSLAVGSRHFALEYKGVLDDGGKLDRVLMLVSDVTIPDADPATPSRSVSG